MWDSHSGGSVRRSRTAMMALFLAFAVFAAACSSDQGEESASAEEIAISGQATTSTTTVPADEGDLADLEADWENLFAIAYGPGETRESDLAELAEQGSIGELVPTIIDKTEDENPRNVTHHHSIKPVPGRDMVLIDDCTVIYPPAFSSATIAWQAEASYNPDTDQWSIDNVSLTSRNGCVPEDANTEILAAWETYNNEIRPDLHNPADPDKPEVIDWHMGEELEGAQWIANDYQSKGQHSVFLPMTLSAEIIEWSDNYAVLRICSRVNAGGAVYDTSAGEILREFEPDDNPIVEYVEMQKPDGEQWKISKRQWDNRPGLRPQEGSQCNIDSPSDEAIPIVQ